MPPPMLLLVIAAYFVGAVPFGFLVGKAKGKDVRKEGSGNIGATNVGRVFGRKYFWVVFIADLLKGLIPTGIAAWRDWGNPAPTVTDSLWWTAVAVAVILGHMFPVYLGFRGGKGVATSLGVMLGVFPYYFIAAIPALTIYIVTFKLRRIVSLASIFGSAAFPVFLILLGFAWPRAELFTVRWPLVAVSVLMATLVIFRHRANIARLRAGTEPQYVPKALQ